MVAVCAASETEQKERTNVQGKTSITDLLLRTVIGANEWERDVKQDVIINITCEFDATKAAETDDLQDTVNYKSMKKKIIAEVEGSSYRLIGKLGSRVLSIVMEDPRVLGATVFASINRWRFGMRNRVSVKSSRNR